jgi:hypothetical protein
LKLIVNISAVGNRSSKSAIPFCGLLLLLLLLLLPFAAAVSPGLC